MVDLVLGEDRVRREDVSRQRGKRVESVRQKGKWKRVPWVFIGLSSLICLALVAFIMQLS